MSQDRAPYETGKPRELSEASTTLKAERDAARRAAIDAIRSMLAALADELAGEEMRGLPNLAGSHEPYRAVSVRTRNRAEPLKPASGSRLVLAMDGQLYMVQLDGYRALHQRAATDDDLVAEDTERVARAIAHASRLHINACIDGTDRYAKLSQLAARLLGALRKEEDDGTAG